MTVYFIQAGENGPIKIGVTRASSSLKRLCKLQGSHYEKLTLLKEVEGYFDLEKWYHELFKKYHIRGEWFNIDKDILSVFPEKIPFPKETFKPKKVLNPKFFEIFNRVKELDNMAAVGREFGISRERVRQIVKQVDKSKLFS